MFNIEITKKHLGLLASTGILIIVVNMVGWRLIGEVFFGIELGLATMLILFISLKIYRSSLKIYQRMKRMEQYIVGTQRKTYKQTESLFSLFFTVKPDIPLPDTGITGDMAASPDFLKKIAEVIHQEQPDLIVEASCGVSTLISAYYLQKIGKGKIISLEHDPKYASLSQALIALHGLQDIATVLHAPLKETDINGRQWLWYDTSGLELDRPIDVLLIDGPPAKIQPLARYPAVPVLFDYLSNSGVILLDDGKRQSERESVEL